LRGEAHSLGDRHCDRKEQGLVERAKKELFVADFINCLGDPKQIPGHGDFKSGGKGLGRTSSEGGTATGFGTLLKKN